MNSFSLSALSLLPRQSALEIQTELREAGLATIAQIDAELLKRAKEEAERGDQTKIEALRRQCEGLIGFTEYRFPRYRAARHHHFVAEQLERVERGEIDRLMS